MPFTQAIRLHLPYCRKAADFRTAAQKGTSALDRLQHSFSRGMPLCCRNHSRTFFVTAFCILLYTVFKKKSVLIGAISVLTGWLFLLVLVIGAIYGAYYLLTGCYTEYEYTVTNGELDVDKIVGKRKRSHLLTVPVPKFTGFGVYTDQTDDPSDATLFLCSDNTGENAYYADFTTEEYGTARLIFTPNEEMVQTIVLFLPAALKRQFRQG